MFDSDYSFKGLHADKVRYLIRPIDGRRIFETFLDLYLCGAVIGKRYEIKETEDTTPGDDATVGRNVFVKNIDRCRFVYRSVILGSWKQNDDKWRVDNTFRTDSDPNSLKKNMELFNSYVLGGVSWLYNKFDGKNDTDEIIGIMNELMDEME